MSAEPIFPFIKSRKTPVLDIFRQKGETNDETSTNAQTQLAQGFQRGLASALGISPEHIRQDLVGDWIIGFSQAIVDPALSGQVEEYGRALGQILSQALPPRGTGLDTGRAGERRGGQPRTEEERKKRHFSTDISPVEM